MKKFDLYFYPDDDLDENYPLFPQEEEEGILPDMDFLDNFGGLEDQITD